MVTHDQDRTPLVENVITVITFMTVPPLAIGPNQPGPNLS